jgi:hypothetical protein
MSNNVTIEQGVQNMINFTNGSRQQALAVARAHLSAYTDGFMSNASDAAESAEWYAKVVRRLSKMVRR